MSHKQGRWNHSGVMGANKNKRICSSLKPEAPLWEIIFSSFSRAYISHNYTNSSFFQSFIVYLYNLSDFRCIPSTGFLQGLLQKFPILFQGKITKLLKSWNSFSISFWNPITTEKRYFRPHILQFFGGLFCIINNKINEHKIYGV